MEGLKNDKKRLPVEINLSSNFFVSSSAISNNFSISGLSVIFIDSDICSFFGWKL